ncbi:MAG: PAS domain S-box protein [Calditrichaeota bacterium]|nr:MAG: PAS domain S-box protein [Calditrichota bacterium]
MSSLKAKDALSHDYLVVTSQVRPMDVMGQIISKNISAFAVFDEQQFEGLVEFKDILQCNPYRIFADLIPKVKYPSVYENTPINKINKVFNQIKFNVLPVFNKSGHFEGIISRQGLYDFLRKNSPDLLRMKKKVRCLSKQIKSERAHIKQIDSNYKIILDRKKEALFLINIQDWRFIDVNDSACESLGYSRKELLDLTVLDIDPNFPLNKLVQLLKDINQEPDKTYGPFQSVHRHKDGHDFPVEIILKLTLINKRKIIMAVARDLTKQKQAEEALAYSEKQYKLFVEKSPNPIFTVNKGGEILSWNEAFKKIFKYENIRDKRYHFLLDNPSEASQIDAMIARVFANETISDLDMVFRCRDGTRRYMIGRLYPQYDYQGNITACIFASTDITRRKKTERALRQAEQRYRDLFDHAPIMYVITKNDQKGPMIVDCNQSFLQALGYSKKEEVVNRLLSDFYTNESTVKLIQEGGYKKALQGKFSTEERDLITKDGKIIHTILRAEPEYDLKGNLIGTRAMFVDITERKKAEQAVQISEERYRTILESIVDGYYEMDLQGNLLFFNESLCKILGYSRDELMGMNYRNFTDRDNANKLMKNFRKVYTTGQSSTSFDWVIINKNGELRYVDASVNLIKDADLQPVGYRGIIRDITERRSLQQQLRHAQKMETIGRLAGGIAHDFNNLLTVILGNVEFGLQDVNEPEKILKDLKHIQQAALRARDLTRQLLSFSRHSVLDKKNINLNDVIHDVLKILKPVIGKDIKINTQLFSELQPILADPAQIQQVIMNLCVNARDAMQEGGQLTIATRHVHASQIKTLIEKSDKSSYYVELSISDTGIGMDASTLEHIFEPFFTTKEEGKGTGLGLSVVYGIVQQHHGHMEVSSEVGKGTTFKIYFPVSKERAFKSNTKETPNKLQGKGEHVLIIDDNDDVRQVTHRLLEALGYRCLLAKNGREAIRLFRKNKKLINLTIIDYKMPEMSGFQICQEIIRWNPQIPVLFVSGNDVQSEVNKLDLPYKKKKKKPFDKNKLGEKIKLLLNQNKLSN